MEFVFASRILSSVRRCAEKYSMIEDGDRIAVGLSGGKDSVALLCALACMRRFYPVKYEVCAVTVDLGFPGMDFSPMEELCRKLSVGYTVVNTEIGRIVFDEKKEKSPCSLCSRMRRGALHSEAERLGCNKVALGHTRDDLAETLVMNVMYSGKIEVFYPKNLPDERGMTLIRPLLYTDEKTVKSFVSKNALPTVKNACPADKNTKRETVKRMLDSVERENKGVRHRILRAIEKAGMDGFFDESPESESTESERGETDGKSTGE